MAFGHLDGRKVELGQFCHEEIIVDRRESFKLKPPSLGFWLSSSYVLHVASKSSNR